MSCRGGRGRTIHRSRSSSVSVCAAAAGANSEPGGEGVARAHFEEDRRGTGWSSAMLWKAGSPPGLARGRAQAFGCRPARRAGRHRVG